MSGRKKAEAMSKQIMGKVKATVGRTTGNKRMEAAGRAEKLHGDMSQVVQKAKDAFKRRAGGRSSGHGAGQTDSSVCPAPLTRPAALSVSRPLSRREHRNNGGRDENAVECLPRPDGAGTRGDDNPPCGGGPGTMPRDFRLRRSRSWPPAVRRGTG